MWEYTIKSSLKNEEHLHYIYNKISNLVLRMVGAITLAKGESECILSLAVPEQSENKITKVLRMLLCDIFCEKMKFDYIKDNWCGEVNNNFVDIFVKVCTYFDLELERKVVMQNLAIGNSVMLDTYIDFCLPKLKQKWADLVNLVNNNVDVFFQDETFFEILGFLVLNLKVKEDRIQVYLSSDNASVVIEQKNLSSIFNVNDIVGVITKLVELSPQNVIVIIPRCSNYTIDRIVQLFGERVKLVEKLQNV